MTQTTEKKLTMRDFLNAIIAGEITDEVVEFATAKIEKMDETNAKRKTSSGERKPSKAQLEKKAENEALAAQMMETVFTETDMATAGEIAAAMEISTPKATVLAKLKVAEGALEVSETKGKSGMVKCYKVAKTEADA